MAAETESDAAIPRSQYQLLRAHEAARAYNEARQKLQQVWSGTNDEFPLDELSLAWLDRVESGATDITPKLVRNIAREINKRQTQLQKSKSTGLADWDSSTVRDFEHTTAADALQRASDAVDAAKQTVDA